MFFALADYLIHSYSLFTMANNRKIANSWIAWVPIGKLWILGSIADHTDEKLSQQSKKWSMTMLIFGLAGTAFTYLAIAAYVIFVFGAAFISAQIDYMDDELAIFLAMLFFIAMIIFVLVIMLCSVVYTARPILDCICMYKIFADVASPSAIKYLIISAIVPFGASVCLFLIRNEGAENDVAQLSSQSVDMPV